MMYGTTCNQGMPSLTSVFSVFPCLDSFEHFETVIDEIWLRIDLQSIGGISEYQHMVQLPSG